MQNHRLKSVFADMPTTIFTEMSALALKHGAINLGQGFPDEDGPLAIREVAARATLEGPNQYPPMRGLLALREAIARHAAHFYGLDYDPESEVVVTSGATEALAASLVALGGAGREVILIEPAYDSYRPIVEAAGSHVKTIALKPPDWHLTDNALERAFSPKTKAIVINSPLNPAGRVFDRDELAAVARMLERFDAIAICDEVYEHLTFDARPHIPLATLAGMRERTVRVGSAGKMFSLTGWKVGWVSGPKHLIRAVANAHQFITFTTAPALQLGVAYALEHEMGFTLELTRTLEANRNLLRDGLLRLGFGVLPCEGTYFLTANISSRANESDRVFCERLTREAGVAAIPLSVFFREGKPDMLVRFAFCKKREVIEEALKRLQMHQVG